MGSRAGLPEPENYLRKGECRLQEKPPRPVGDKRPSSPSVIVAAMIQIQSIDLASLGAGALKVKAGNRTDTWRGTIFTAGGPIVAYVKMLPTNQLISESVCALLGRALGLNMPRPFLVHVKRKDLPKSKEWKGQENERICFGSEDAKHPSLKQIIEMGKGNSAINDKIVKHWLDWKGFRETAIFDEWIANPDRNIGNVLYDGTDFHLIDHSHALTSPKWKPADLKPDISARNIWLDHQKPYLSEAEKKEWEGKAGLERFRYQCVEVSDLPERASMKRYSSPAERDAVSSFIQKRAGLILQLICRRLNIGLLPL